MVPHLLPNQLSISLTCQEPRPKQKWTHQGPPPVCFVLLKQSTTLQDKSLIGSNGQEITYSEVDKSNVEITVIKQKTSELEIKYRKK